MMPEEKTRDEDLFYMDMAIAEAKTAGENGDVPVGAVIVRGGKLISTAHNTRERSKNALAHAECLAISEACASLGGWRLPGCTLYVTLEPCPMCAGAIINSRLQRVVFGLRDPAAGAFGSVVDLSSYPLGFRPEITGGVREAECRALLREFFEKRRLSSGK